MTPRRLYTAFALSAALAAAASPAEDTRRVAVPADQTAPPADDDRSIAPTWETQKSAATHTLTIPPPRGQIVDRNGNPLAQTRVSHNLAIRFPTPLTYSDAAVLQFARMQVAEARGLIGRDISLDEEAALKHYRSRGILPFDIAQDLLPEQIEAVRRRNPKHLVLKPIYLRFYPNGKLAGHVIGYAGRSGRGPSGPVQNNDPLWPGQEGREGIEQTFDEQLTGRPGQMNIAVDAAGNVASERITIPPQPGYNVVTTLDESIQRLCEETLAKGARRGAIVLLDPNNGDVLALASWPVFNPNAFVPSISADAFAALQNDPDIPLLSRAFRSSYPAGSTFKVFVGLAALESNAIETGDEFACPAAFSLGRLTFRNWKKEHMGMLNFRQALIQSCNTWFYQVGIKTGSKALLEWTGHLGLGQRTGIPLLAEAEGRIPTDEYMQKTYGRRLMDGDLANLAIGQGDILISPLQMAQAMGAIGNGGTLLQTRLVRQVQSIDGKIVTAYEVRARDRFDIDPKILSEMRKAMVGVVSDGMGTAGQAAVKGVRVAGKTGTAQWGPKRNERTAAWFAGFAPAENPRYAFAALYEGPPGDDDVHGGTHAAPMIGKVLRELFKREKEAAKKAAAEAAKKKSPDAGESDDPPDADDPAPKQERDGD